MYSKIYAKLPKIKLCGYLSCASQGICIISRNEPFETFYRMETLRCVYGYRRKNGHFCYTHPDLVCIHIFHYDGIAADRLFCSGFLDEYEEVYSFCQKKSVVVSIGER